MVKNMSTFLLEAFPMYAIIETGGRQYKVAQGDILHIEKIDNKKSVTFGDVLLVSDGDKISVGNPFVQSSEVHRLPNLLWISETTRVCWRSSCEILSSINRAR